MSRDDFNKITHHSYCNFIITGNSIVDITLLSETDYEFLFRHFSGLEVTIFPTGNGNSSMSIKRYTNPIYDGFVITSENLRTFIRGCTRENKTVYSTCEWAKNTVYNDFGELYGACKSFCKVCNHMRKNGSCYKN